MSPIVQLVSKIKLNKKLSFIKGSSWKNEISPLITKFTDSINCIKFLLKINVTCLPLRNILSKIKLSNIIYCKIIARLVSQPQVFLQLQLQLEFFEKKTSFRKT